MFVRGSRARIARDYNSRDIRSPYGVQLVRVCGQRLDMASFTYDQGLGEILKSYVADIDEGLVSVVSAIGESTGAIGEHLK